VYEIRSYQFIIRSIVALILFGISAAPAPHLAKPGDEVDQCLSCHTDKDALISTAKPEDAAESENEGEG